MQIDFSEDNILMMIFLVIIIFDLIYGFYLLTKSKSFVKKSHKATAQVISSELLSGKKNNAIFETKIAFMDLSGKKVTVVIKGKSYVLGSNVKILYSPLDSSHYKLDNWAALYSVPTLMLTSPIYIILIALYLINSGTINPTIFDLFYK